MRNLNSTTFKFSQKIGFIAIKVIYYVFINRNAVFIGKKFFGSKT